MTNGDNCRNDCASPPDFPKVIENRPGLSRIAYRIGTYSDFREAIMRGLNRSDALQAWSHRGSDDPGIALLEGASVVGDVLTFYQELYANQVYLRTAEWRESISDLVRLLGYRLSPGLGGKATFALTFRGEEKVEIPAGFPIKADVDGLDQQATFETTSKATAYPQIGEFTIFPPTKTPKFTSSVTIFSIPTATLNNADMQIEEKDRLILLDEVNVSTSNSQIVVVKKVETRFEYTHITIEGTWEWGNNKNEIYAFKLGRTSRHFGHNAPAEVVKISGSSSSQVSITYNRKLNGSTFSTGNTTIKPSFSAKKIPLDQKVDDLAAGMKIVIEGTAYHGVTNVRTVKSVKAGSMTWGALTGATTILELDKEMKDDSHDCIFETTDIRAISLHEVSGIQLTLKPPIAIDDSTDKSKLYFFGDATTYALLDKRQAAFWNENGDYKVITLATESYASATASQKLLRPVKVTSDLWEEFSLSDFPLEDATVVVYGNLVDADQGEMQKEKVLGNGDSRQTFQTFKLPKAPLTYHISAGETPPEVPELQIYVDDRLWERVSDFYGHDGDEEIYVVREDDNGDSWVQFGDGKTGRRLPAGIKNVTAKFRTGTGAYGGLQENKKPQAGGKLNRIDKIYLPDPEGASGGSIAETGENAKEAAPGKVQSLDRLVSLEDFESEALAIAGVSKVLAAWDLVDNIPIVRLTVLMETGRQTELDDVEKTLKKYNRCRGPNRFPIQVVAGSLEYVYAAAEVAYDLSYRQELVEADIRTALGTSGQEANGVNESEGLFALKRRRFGESEYATRVAAVIQNVPGVLWTRVISFASLCSYGSYSWCEGISPEDITWVEYFSSYLADKVPCSSQRILSLYADHLKLTAVSAPTEVC